MSCGCQECDDCNDPCKKRCHDRENETEDLQFPRTNIYRCFDPCTCDSNCILCN